VLYLGLATAAFAARTFECNYQLADHVEAKGARLDSRLPHVNFVREIPEAMKPRAIRSRVPGRCLSR
jgi:hypothetical protein